MVMHEQNKIELKEQCEKYVQMKLDLDIKEVRENIFFLNQEMTRINNRFAIQKRHVVENLEQFKEIRKASCATDGDEMNQVDMQTASKLERMQIEIQRLGSGISKLEQQK